IKRLENKIESYKVASKAINGSTEIQNKISNPNYNFQQGFNAETLNHCLLLKHKCLVDEVKEYNKNNDDTIFKV
ncbi:8289_t:CDS:2, partial [Ambispora leptoticha]